MGDWIDTTEMDVVVAIKGRELLVYAGGIRQTELAYMKLAYHAKGGLKWHFAHENKEGAGPND